MATCTICKCKGVHYRFCKYSLLQKESIEQVLKDLKIAGVPPVVLKMIDDWATDNIGRWGEKTILSGLKHY